MNLDSLSHLSMDGKTAVVTGSTQGLGEAIAHLFAERGIANLVITGRNAGRGAKVKAALEAKKVKTIFVEADLSRMGDVRKVIAACDSSFGRLDALVNAAALTDRASMLDGTVDLWNRLFSVNTRAPYMLMQALIRHLRARGAPGGVVNILSVNAHCGAPELAIYSATKGALLTLTKNAAHAHLADRIRVNGINMGWVATPGEQVMQAETLGHGPGWQARAAASHKLTLS